MKRTLATVCLPAGPVSYPCSDADVMPLLTAMARAEIKAWAVTSNPNYRLTPWPNLQPRTAGEPGTEA